MSMIKHARTAMGLNQSSFGAFLADKVNRDAPFPKSRISNYETGKVTPNKRIRNVCSWIAARDAAKQIESLDRSSPDYQTTMARLIVESQSLGGGV